MTEEERFKQVYNIYMNYEAELATRGMPDIPPIAASLTNSYLLHEIKEILTDNNSSMTFIAGDEVLPEETQAIIDYNFEDITKTEELDDLHFSPR